MRIAITSGYYDPLHSGHVDCFRLAREQNDALWVILNNKYQSLLKRGSQPFQEEECRLDILKAIRYIDRVVLATDRDSTVCQTLEMLIQEAQKTGHEVSFNKGGDRFSHNTPEKKICDQYGVRLIDGLGEKTYSSSEYLKRARE